MRCHAVTVYQQDREVAEMAVVCPRVAVLSRLLRIEVTACGTGWYGFTVFLSTFTRCVFVYMKTMSARC